jgi:hypothetical protein
MIHDRARVQSIRGRVACQVELIRSLQAKIVKGKLDTLEVALRQTEDIETFFLADLERNDRTPAEEAMWLSSADRMFQMWEPYLKKTQEQFSRSGAYGIEIVSG